MHQTVLRSIYSVQLFRAAGRRPPEVNLALSRGRRHLRHLEAAWGAKLVEFLGDSGKIHCVLGIMVDLHGFSQGLRISAVALS